MLVIAAPGQGAQTPGFVTDWLAVTAFADAFQGMCDATGLDLVASGTIADADKIRDTKIAQPLLVAASLSAARALGSETLALAALFTGHSVGELAAAGLSGALTDAQTAQLVRRRGDAMAEAAAQSQTSMTAVLGGDRDQVLAAIESCGLTAANDNGAGQIVAAGTVEQLALFADNPPEKARLIPLAVAGAFHTEHMAPAIASLRELADTFAEQTPHTPTLSNRDGAVVSDGHEVLTRIVGQIANPVRWDLCMEQMLALGVTGFLELPPAGTLTGIARRAMKGIETFALKSPDQLDEARAFCRAHAG